MKPPGTQRCRSRQSAEQGGQRGETGARWTRGRSAAGHRPAEGACAPRAPAVTQAGPQQTRNCPGSAGLCGSGLGLASAAPAGRTHPHGSLLCPLAFRRMAPFLRARVLAACDPPFTAGAQGAWRTGRRGQGGSWGKTRRERAGHTCDPGTTSIHTCARRWPPATARASVTRQPRGLGAQD